MKGRAIEENEQDVSDFTLLGMALNEMLLYSVTKLDVDITKLVAPIDWMKQNLLSWGYFVFGIVERVGGKI